MQVIYVDVLLFFNFCVNYFLLRGTAFLTHTPCRIPRCLLSALLGSFSALVILLPPLPLAVNLLIRLGTAAGMNGVLCFGLSRRTMLRQTIWFFCCSMLFAGFLMFLQQSTNSRRIFWAINAFTCSFLFRFAFSARYWHMEFYDSGMLSGCDADIPMFPIGSIFASAQKLGYKQG